MPSRTAPTRLHEPHVLQVEDAALPAPGGNAGTDGKTERVVTPDAIQPVLPSEGDTKLAGAPALPTTEDAPAAKPASSGPKLSWAQRAAAAAELADPSPQVVRPQVHRP